MRFAGLQEGSCKDQGFTQPDGGKELTVPVLGHIGVAFFKRASAGSFLAVEVAEPQATLFKIEGDRCGEASVGEKFKGPAMQFAGLQEGSCKDQGFTQPDGGKELTVPVLGHIGVAFFKRASAGSFFAVEVAEPQATLFKIEGGG